MKITSKEITDSLKVLSCGNSFVKISTLRQGKEKKYLTYRLAWKVGKRGFRRAYNNEEKALAEATRIIKSLATAEGSVTRASGEDVIYYRECQKKLGKTPLHIAVDFYLKYHGIASGEQRLFKEVSAEFLASKLALKKLAGKTAKGDRYLQTLKSQLVTWEGVFGEQNIREITGQVIAKQLTEKWLDKYSLTSKDNLLECMSALMRFAQTKNYISREHLPTSEVALPPAPRKTPSVMTPEELKKVLLCVDPRAIPYFAIMAFGGGRRTELEKSTTENMNLEDGKIFIPPEIAKKNSGRGLKIQDNLNLWLTEFAKYDGKLVGKKFSTPFRYKKKFEKVGITWKPNWHRHSFCTYFIELTDNLALTSKIAGNSQSMLEKHYAASNVTKSAAEEWFSITPDSVREYAKKNGLAELLTW